MAQPVVALMGALFYFVNFDDVWADNNLRRAIGLHLQRRSGTMAMVLRLFWRFGSFFSRLCDCVNLTFARCGNKIANQQG